MTNTLTPMAEMWAKVAPHWRTYAEYADARGAEVTELLLDLAEVSPGDRVLELAGGAGGTGIAAAHRVGAGGGVVITDLVEEMTEIAAERATKLGLHWVTSKVIDLQRIDEPDDSFDVVLCREGLMFAAAPDEALVQIRRVLRDGGRVALAVWGPRERNPWLGLVFDVATAETGQPVPPPGIAGPFALSDPDQLSRLFDTAGFTDVSVIEQSCPLVDRSFASWWTRTCALAGPLAARLEAMSDQQRAALHDRARAAVQPYQAAGWSSLPGSCTHRIRRRLDRTPINADARSNWLPARGQCIATGAHVPGPAIATAPITSCHHQDNQLLTGARKQDCREGRLRDRAGVG